MAVKTVCVSVPTSSACILLSPITLWNTPSPNCPTQMYSSCFSTKYLTCARRQYVITCNKQLRQFRDLDKGMPKEDLVGLDCVKEDMKSLDLFQKNVQDKDQWQLKISRDLRVTFTIYHQHYYQCYCDWSQYRKHRLVYESKSIITDSQRPLVDLRYVWVPVQLFVQFHHWHVIWKRSICLTQQPPAHG